MGGRRGSTTDTLAQTSLAALVARDEALEAGNYPTPPDSHRPIRAAIAVA